MTQRHDNGKYWREDKSNEDKWKNLTYLKLKFRNKKNDILGAEAMSDEAKNVLKPVKPEQTTQKENSSYLHYSILTKKSSIKVLKTARRKGPMIVTRATIRQTTDF